MSIFSRIFKKEKQNDVLDAIEPDNHGVGPAKPLPTTTPDTYAEAFAAGWDKAKVIRNQAGQLYPDEEHVQAVMKPATGASSPQDEVKIIFLDNEGRSHHAVVKRLQLVLTAPFDTDDDKEPQVAPQFVGDGPVPEQLPRPEFGLGDEPPHLTSKPGDQVRDIVPNRSILNSPIKSHGGITNPTPEPEPEPEMKTIKDMVNPQFLSALPKTEIPEFDDQTISEVSARVEKELEDLAEEKKWIDERLKEMAKAKTFFNNRQKQIDALVEAYGKVEKAADVVEKLAGVDEDDPEAAWDDEDK